jgi:hypothetical protein
LEKGRLKEGLFFGGHDTEWIMWAYYT